MLFYQYSVSAIFVYSSVEDYLEINVKVTNSNSNSNKMENNINNFSDKKQFGHLGFGNLGR